MYPAPPVTRTRMGAAAYAKSVRYREFRLLGEEAPAGGEADQVDGGVGVQLAQDAAPVGLDRSRADAELLGDLRGGMALDAELEDLALARGQGGQRGAGAFGPVV